MTIRRIRLLLILTAFAVLCMCVGRGMETFGVITTTAVSAEDMIEDTLTAMGVDDARRAEDREKTVMEAEGAECVCYTSDSMGFAFYFYADTGYLRNAESTGCSYSGKEDGTAVLTSDINREAESLRLAELLIRSARIGELQIEKMESTQLWDRFYVVEYYDGVPTGTSVTIAWEGNQVQSCVPHYGKRFIKTANGEIRRAHEGSMISEEQAIHTALDAVLDALEGTEYSLLENTASCEWMIHLGSDCYQICVEAEGSINVSFMVLIDAYSGAVLEIAHTL